MEWISVEDRFPPKPAWVIGATYIGLPSMGKIRISKELFYDGENEHGHHWLSEGDWENKVTHWMPLPEPPN